MEYSHYPALYGGERVLTAKRVLTIVLVTLALSTLLVGAISGVALAKPDGSTPTPQAGGSGNQTSGNSTDSQDSITKQEIMRLVEDNTDISKEKAQKLYTWYIQHQDKFSKTEVREVAQYFAKQLPENGQSQSTPTNETSATNSQSTNAKYGVQKVTKKSKKSLDIYASVPGTSTAVVSKEWMPDENAARLTIYIGDKSREVVTVTDLGDVRSGDTGSAVITTRRYVLDDDMGGNTITIRVPATTGRRGTQAVALSFRSGSNPIAIFSGIPEIWERPASHWMAGFGILLGGSIMAAVVLSGRNKHPPLEREH